MTKEEIIKKLRDMAKYPTVTLPRDTEALRNAADLLEQAQQAEPFGYFQFDLRLDAWVQNRHSDKGVAFYTSPPQRQPLTDEQINKKWSEALADTEGQTYLPLTEFARAIEAAHGITGEQE